MEKLKMQDLEFAELARVLRRVDFFAPLTIGQLEEVLPFVLRCSYAAGEEVFAHGDPGDAFYVVSSGKVAVQVREGFFRFKKTLSTLGAGEFFGEMALLSRAPRSASVSCLEPTILYVLMAKDFDFIVKKNPSFAAEVSKIAERRRFLSSHGG